MGERTKEETQINNTIFYLFNNLPNVSPLTVNCMARFVSGSINANSVG